MKVNGVSIRTKLIIYSISLIFITMLVISITSYNASESVLKDQIGDKIYVSTKQVMLRTTELLQVIHKMALTITHDSRLQRLLRKDELESYDDLREIIDYSGYLYTFNYIDTQISSMYIYSVRNMFYMSATVSRNHITAKDENYKLTIENFGDLNNNTGRKYFIWIGGRMDESGSYQNFYSSIILPIYDGSRVLLLGSLIINISEKQIASMFNESLGETGKFLIEDQNGTVISSNNKELIGQKSNFSYNSEPYIKNIEDEDYWVCKVTSEYNGWSYISVTPMASVMEANAKSLKKSLIAALLISVPMLMIVSYFINRAFYNPTKYFIDQLKRKVKSREKIEPINRKDEIGYIFNNICDILNENDNLLKKVYEEKVNSKNYELKALQAQINPHFLYNSLSGAICMIKLKKHHIAEEMISSLIDLYRLSLDESKKIITVSEEIKSLDKYVSIQKIRYGDKFNVSVDVDDDILECMILKFLLQPLVENSLYHGIRDSQKKINITVRGQKEGEIIIFSVFDDGKGMTVQQLTEITGIINNVLATDGHFYILQNINSRIKLHYGDEFGVGIDSEEERYTKIEIRVPFVK